MASSFALGYMLAVPLLTALTDRMDARLILLTGSAVSGLATFAFGLLADGLWSAIAIWAHCGHRLRRRLHAGPQGAGGPPAAGRQLAQRHHVHGDVLDRRRPVVPDRPDRGGRARVALGLLPHRARAAGDDCGLPRHGARRAGAVVAAAARLQAGVPQPRRPWASSWATARTASSCMRCAPGSSRSGPTWWRATAARRCSSRSPSASSPRFWPCRPASSATRPPSASAGIAPSCCSCASPGSWRS